MMKTDLTVGRIRQTRHAISVQCDHDPRKLVAYYMKYQEKYRERLIAPHQRGPLPDYSH